MNPKEHAEAVKAARNGSRALMARLLVEGSYFTYAQMAERTGKTIQVCKSRYSHLKQSGKWPITWEMLGD